MTDDDPVHSDTLLPTNVNDRTGFEFRTENIEESNDFGPDVTFRRRFKSDETFRDNILMWVCLCMSNTVFGWDFGQLGPSLLDLKEITNSRLEEASFFLTSIFFGYLLGTTMTGAIYQRMDPFLLLFLGISCLGFTSAAIPWCIFYWLMIALQLLKGFGFGVLDTAGNSVFMAVFKNEKNIQSYLSTIHLTFAIGGFLSPIATAPFLMKQIDDMKEITNSSHDISNSSVTDILVENLSLTKDPYVLYGINSSKCQNHTSGFTMNSTKTITTTIKLESELYKAYSITAICWVILAIRFLWMYLKARKLSRKNDSAKPDIKTKLTLREKCAVLMLICLFLGIDNGMEDAFFGMFSTFIVIQLGWTKQQGSYAISVYWASFACGRLSSIFVGTKLDFRRMLCFHMNIFLLAMIGFFVSAKFKFSIGIWICFPVMGFAVSVFFPIIFLWTADFMTVAGRVSSCLLISSSLGSMIHPILIGFLIDNFGAMWFAYVTLVDGIALWIIFWITINALNNVKKNLTTEVNIEVVENVGRNA